MPNIVSTSNVYLDAQARKLGISQQQRIFADNYIANGFNIVSAARSAGYKGKPITINKTFLNPSLQKYISQAMLSVMDKLNIDKDSVVRILADIAFFDATTLLCEITNEPIPVVELTKQARNAIQKVNTIRYKPEGKKEYITKVTGYILHDKTKALEMLGKHFGIFEKDNHQSRSVINQNINIKWD